MVSLLVDTVSFVDAGAHAHRSARAVESALSRASSDLGALSQMAGSDPNGAKWAEAYDQGAGQIFSYTGVLQDAVAAFARKLEVTGYYYELVEATNAGGNGAGLSLTAPASQSMCLSVPSAAGGKRVFPNPNPAFEWIAEQVSNLVGEMWPDGDTGKLDAASRVWHRLADDLDAVATGLTSVTDALAGIGTPELSKIHTSVSQLRSLAKKLASAARQVGSACNELSGKISYVHVQTEITVGVLIAAVAVTAGASLGLTVFTFGISDVVGAGAIAGETGGAVATILGFIAELSASISTTVGGIVAASAEFVGIGGTVAAGIGTVAGDMTAGAVLWGVAGAGENTIVTGITEPGSDLLEAAKDGFIDWGVTGGVFGAAFGAGRLVAGEGMAAASSAGLPVAENDSNFVLRETSEDLFRSDDRPPAEVFKEGFRPLDPNNNDLEDFVRNNTPSNFVSTTRDPDLYKDWGSQYRYTVTAPGGIDVNATIADNIFSDESEVAFQGGVRPNDILGAHPVLPGGSLGSWVPNPSVVAH